MADYFLDTSALVKHYHPEVGTLKVDQLLAEQGARHFISRLAVLEMQSALAAKVLAGVLPAPDFQLLRRRFLADVLKRKLNVVGVVGVHWQEAGRLVRQYGPRQRLRTLDALQLSVAVDLRTQGMLDHCVCADQHLVAVGIIEGLSMINPEQP